MTTHPSWCSPARCRVDDTDGTRFHRLTLIPSEHLTVDACVVTDPDGTDLPLEVQVRVDDEPPLTALEARALVEDLASTLDDLGVTAYEDVAAEPL